MAKTSTELVEKLRAEVPAQEKKQSPIHSIKELLEANKGEIAKALPKHITPDRLLKTCLGAIRQNPQLLECTRESLIGAIMTSAELGLEPGPLGHAYLVPYNSRKKINGEDQWVKEVQFQIGYKGMLELIYRGGQVATIVANPVYANELGDIEIDRAAGTVKHPYKFREDPGEFVGVYAYAVTKDGMTHCEPMTRAEIEKVRKLSKSANGPAWTGMYEEMARKTALKRLMKRLPMAVERAESFLLAEAKDETVGQIDFTPRAEIVVPVSEPAAPELESKEPDWEEVRRSTLKRQAEFLAKEGVDADAV
jgi:recombination protein RecT